MVQVARTKAGSSDRAGFIEVPIDGPAKSAFSVTTRLIAESGFLMCHENKPEDLVPEFLSKKFLNLG